MNAILVLACLLVPQEAEPADGGTSTDYFQWARDIDDLDLSWEWGDFYFEFHGEADLEFFVLQDESPGFHVEDSAIRDDETSVADDNSGFEVAWRVPLFLDGFYQEWLEYSIELRLDGTTGGDGNVGARPEQYWARFILMDEEKLTLQVGKFAAPIGNFIPRHRPSKNPLTTWPLAYDQVTTLTSVADTSPNLVAIKDIPDLKHWYPVIWQAVYGTGVMGTGVLEGVAWAVAITNSAPATRPANWDPNSDNLSEPTFYLRASTPVDITTTVGASFSVGPYENDDSVSRFVPGPGPPGTGTNVVVDGQNWPQRLFGVDVAYSTGFLEIFAEGYWSELTGPEFEDLEIWTYYVEGKYRISPGLFGAARFAQMFFGKTDDPFGDARRWDRDITRIEFGGGYFFTKNLFLKGTAQFNFTMGGREPRDHMLMIQTGLMF